MQYKFKRAASITIAAMMITQLLVSSITTVHAINPFTDVKSDAYYYEPVIAMYDMGVVAGYGGGIFGPNDSVTHSQMLLMLSRVLDIDVDKYATKNTWDSGVREWATRYLFNGDTNIEWSEPATRYDVAEYIVNVLDLEDVEVPDDYQPFTDTGASEVEILAYNGIIAGYPGPNGTFLFGGNDNVTRGQACTFLYRVLNHDFSADADDNDNKDDEDNTEEDNQTSEDVTVSSNRLGEFYNSFKLPEKITCQDDILNAFVYMAVNKIDNVKFECNTSDKNAISSMWSEAHNDFYEYFPEYARLTSYRATIWSGSGNCKLELTAIEAYTPEQIKEVEDAVINTLDNMYATGKLSENMSIKDKCKVIAEYITVTYQYDLTYSVHDIYEMVHNGWGVCEAYGSLYNMMCRIDNIPMMSQRGEGYGGTGPQKQWGGHLWNYIVLDGQTHYIDVTWMDPVPNRKNYTNWKWFWVDEADFFVEHRLTD